MQKENEAIISRQVHSRKSGVQVFAENPFWQPTEVEVGKKYIRTGGGQLVDGDGEVRSFAGIHKVETVDKDQFVKLYTRNMKVFFDLKPSVQKVLQVILAIVQKNPNADAIFLQWFEVQNYSIENELKISQSSFHRAMKDLLSKQFLAEAESANKYWINPHLFFNGDRMTFINEYRVKQNDQNKEDFAKLKADRLKEQQNTLF